MTEWVSSKRGLPVPLPKDEAKAVAPAEQTAGKEKLTAEDLKQLAASNTLEYLKKHEARVKMWAEHHSDSQKLPLGHDGAGNITWLNRKQRRAAGMR